MSETYKRLRLLQDVAYFSGPPRERLALREAVRVFEVRLDQDPVTETERRINAERINGYYRSYSPEFRRIYRAINAFFADELRRKADELDRLVQRLDRDSVEYVFKNHNHNE